MADQDNARIYERPHPLVMRLPLIAILLALAVLGLVVVMIRFFPRH